MKLSVSRFAVLFCTLAVVLVSAFASVASAFQTYGQPLRIGVSRYRAATVGSVAESLSFQLVTRSGAGFAGANLNADTSSVIDLQRCSLPLQLSSSTFTIGALNVVISSPGAVDSVAGYWQVSYDGTNWGTASALTQSTGTAGDKWFKIPLIATPGTKTNSEPFLARYARFIFTGDTGGTSGGVSLYWIPLAESYNPTVGQ